MTPGELAQEYLLALAVWREARGEPLLGKLYVAQVIANRVADPRWPSTIEDVILQPRQFSAFDAADPNTAKFPRAIDPQWPDCVAAARLVLAGGQRLTEANHYCTADVTPSWTAGRTPGAIVGRHRFYVL